MEVTLRIRYANETISQGQPIISTLSALMRMDCCGERCWVRSQLQQVVGMAYAKGLFKGAGRDLPT